MKKGAAYIRVSTEEQTEYSPASQRQLLLEYAGKNMISLDEEHIYCDDGISGRTAEKRPEFMRMIGVAKTRPRPFDVILIWKYSRFARNMEESILYKGLLRKLGINLISISEPLPDGEFASLMERVIEWMDQYYSVRLGGEVRRGMTEAASRGKPVSIAPIGYRMEDGRLTVDEERAVIVRRIYDGYCAGKGTREIARELNSLDIRTNRGGRWENRTVEDILRNKTYTGVIRWNTKRKTRRNYGDPDIIEARGSHERIISVEQFERVQTRLDAQKEFFGRYSRTGTGRDHMLRGLVKCGTCGAALTRCTNGSLQCHNYVRGKCPVSHSIALDRLGSVVVRTLEQVLSGTVPPVFSPPRAAGDGGAAGQLVADSINREKKRLERIYSSYEEGIYTKDEFILRKEKAESRVKELEIKLAETKAALSVSEPAPDLADAYLDVIKILKDETAGEQNKNAALRSIVDRIVLERPDNTVSIYLMKNSKAKTVRNARSR